MHDATSTYTYHNVFVYALYICNVMHMVIISAWASMKCLGIMMFVRK